jgi:hypothetical protein
LQVAPVIGSVSRLLDDAAVEYEVARRRLRAVALAEGPDPVDDGGTVTLRVLHAT